MISCENFGRRVRLGNQLFQYAWLRTTARRLGTQFFCPPWIGDEVYELGDAAERAREPAGLAHTQVEQRELRCVTCPVVRDGTSITGYFQSPHHFDRDDAHRWFTLRHEIAEAVFARHSHIDFDCAIGLHMRLGDYVRRPTTALRHYVPPRGYYAAALERLPPSVPVVVCSDEPDEAERRLGPLVDSRFVFLRGNCDFEDLLLLSHCRHLICSPSTFSWWAAWLRPADAAGQVFVPREGLFRTAYQIPAEPEVVWHQPGWTTLPALPPRQLADWWNWLLVSMKRRAA